MRAVMFHEYGEPDVLQVGTATNPIAGPNEVVVELGAIGVNHVELDVRDGSSRFDIELPHIPGMEGAGTVIEVGSDVTTLKVGQRVAMTYLRTCDACAECMSGNEIFCPTRTLLGWQIQGTYAERIAVPASMCLPIADSLSFQSAAASIVTLGSAWHALTSRAQVKVGETVLIHSIGSGVGTAGLQICKKAGARVIGTVGSDAKIQQALDAGADHVFNHQSHDFVEEVMAYTQGRGVDVVLDMVGGEAFARSMFAMRPNGRLVTVGAHGGEVVELDVISFFRNHVTYMGSHSMSRLELGKVLELLADGTFVPEIHGVYPLEEASEAHRLLTNRENFGKVLLDPSL
ncbi:MAG: zinc-binding dehydrogenase [Actinobacteria bacterium]|jgi:NADPH:quinone reductase-like Zn-dependent oxidoreductase|nr:zinc-binding dehydrogenase [Actinomycetota bacterium]MBT5807502.1 zinc-binding dehydrogenase [Actinomycetota bacterium]